MCTLKLASQPRQDTMHLICHMTSASSLSRPVPNDCRKDLLDTVIYPVLLKEKRLPHCSPISILTSVGNSSGCMKKISVKLVELYQNALN